MKIINSKIFIFILIIFCGFVLKPLFALALEVPLSLQNKSVEQLKAQDSDQDGLSDYEEIYIYKTDPLNKDTDKDGWEDGVEVKAGYDPNVVSDEKIDKSIDVDLQNQTLSYFLGNYEVGSFKISSGVAKMPSPKGKFSVLKKMPFVNYGSKTGAYYYPNTKWNLFFKQGAWGGFYIHGAYWHHNFGHPMSHGCINVSYGDMEGLYNWADVGTKITIH